MKISKLMMIATIMVAPIYVAPVSAQTTEQWEAMDAAFEQCKARFIRDNFGDDSQAAQYCYPRIYGGETSGGGEPGGWWTPIGGNQCYGQQAPCNPLFNQP